MRKSFLMLFALAACNSSPIGQAPEFSPPERAVERNAMLNPGSPNAIETTALIPSSSASLWTGARGSLLGDRRAIQRGDILTVVIEIDDKAEISNSSDRSRSASQQAGVPQLLGIPQRLDPRLPEGASSAALVDLNSQSSSSGDGSVRRNEKLELRVAVTITDVLPNGVLSIVGQQEVRVNFELRELLVTGYVRPEDITRQNEITYDKIASARISYGGRGQITDVQQPRYGQQALDAILPF
ncbi:flagellar basal body L-ring protein FlgH [Yoonia sediminilitoris]|uniref:Flagellar L-ring protein n=1 Tax=Yoonia sediminilitoris TaxID=1286148 RepID=A0A2T6KA95_9RHOB|nr:flagellar basal body L-ring protein FlgH [Yoonia sediminilitoris]PUB11776.1 flagellar L-ring protein precursor FlgH [Yoonia sediminilitoris]RCW91853.1 flagellar L-ring protein precursor FlgH [Yoonia sediminilitoris]